MAADPGSSKVKVAWQDTIWHQWAEKNPDWVSPIEPFRVIGNIYYVGSEGIGAYLISSDAGHIVLDGGLPQNAKQIAHSVEALGFSLSDVKYLINSHAHFDHSGGLQELKEKTGAKVIASEGDAVWLENGLYPGAEDGLYNSIPVKVDRLIEDGGQLQVGSTTLSAHITPGHTPGCTSWQMDAADEDQVFRVLFFCGAAVAGNRLFPEPQYPGIVNDYRSTLQAIQEWEVDVFLSNHPFYFDMLEKRAAQLAGNQRAFVDSREFGAAAAEMLIDFEIKLANQKRKAENTK
jgi:metallo-beta-lactamase class B